MATSGKGKPVYLALAIAAMAALLFAASSTTSVQAKVVGKDPKGDSVFRDFDIKKFGFKKGEAYVSVYGDAGGTLPSGEKTIFAYVIHTNTGIYASDSHEAQHADDEQVANLSWHGHKVEIDSDGCIEEIGSFKSKAILDGHRVIITETAASEIYKAQTVRLELQVDDPDNPPPGVTCIAKIMEVFDEAVPIAGSDDDDDEDEDDDENEGKGKGKRDD